MYESPRRSFRSSTDRFTALYNSRPFLASANILTNLLDNLRPLFGIYEHPYEPAEYKYTAEPLESLYGRL